MRLVPFCRRGRAVFVAVLVSVASAGLATPAYAGMPAGGAEGDASLPQIALAPKKCAKAVINVGWAGADRVIGTAVALAESGCDPSAESTNPPTEGCPSGSTDRGVWQINSCYHPEVPDSCAYRLKCSTEAAREIWGDAGDRWSPWVAYTTRVFKYRLTEARKAVRKLTGENIVVGVVMTLGGDLTVRRAPRTSSDAVGSLPNSAVILVTCQTRGELVHSEVFDYDTRLWDKLGDHQYVSDGYVYTDASGRIADRC